MSGTQGRFPPAMPPAAPQAAAPAWPPAVPQQHHTPTGQPHAQQAPFPPRFQAQPPALPGGFDAGPQSHQGHGQPSYAPPPQQLPPMQAWVPQPPQPYPSATPASAPAQPAVRAPDPSAYDLGNYGVPQAAPPAARAPQPQWDVPASQRPTMPHPTHQMPMGHPQQPAPLAYGQPGSAQHAQQPAAPYPASYQPAQPQRGPEAHLPPDQAGEQQDDEYEYEDDEPPSRRRWLVAAALVGSIVTGGVLAYGYKAVTGPKGSDQTQIVRASKEPVKSAPANPGGRQLPNTGSASLNNRLPSEGTSTAAGGDAGSIDSNGVRRVSTVAVGRETSTSVGASGVPGMQIVASPGGFPTPGAIPAAPPVPSAPPQRQAAVPVTQVAAAPPPAVQRPPQATRIEAAEPPAAPVRKQILAARPSNGDGATSAAAPRPKPTGHVAVLGYRRSQMDAMRAMADVQQRFEILRDKKLEVVQSDESSRGLGVIYRIVVGPRGSVTQAREVCTQLQQAGMPAKDCYTLAN